MANGQKEHLLLNARTGWRAALPVSTVRFTDDGFLKLRPQPGSIRPLVDAGGSLGGLQSPTGLAVDDEDRIYILDSKAHNIKEFDPCLGVFKILPCIGGCGSRARELREPRGLAISPRGDLYVADTGNRRIQIFALKGLPLRTIWGPLLVKRVNDEIQVEQTFPQEPAANSSPGCLEAEPVFAEGTWQPFDIAVSADCWAYVSDYCNNLIHVFDPGGRWCTAFTGEAEDAPALEKPTHIALDKKCRLYILQEGKDCVTVLDKDGKFVEQVKTVEDVKGRFCPISIAVDPEGNICIADRVSRRVHTFCQTDDDGHAYTGAWRVFNGIGTALGFDNAGNPILADNERGRVCQLGAPGSYELEGLLYSEALDSRIYRCQWHRVLMRAAIEPGTRVRVDTFTSEAPKSSAEIQSLPDARWATAQINSLTGDGDWDCLIQSAQGRYLWLRLTLSGEGTSTPVVKQLKIYYPRNSSLQYLPAVYSEDAASHDFLDRFLSIFDQIRDSISLKIGNIASYFNPASTPADASEQAGVDFLSWLASWLDLTLDRHWPEWKRRRLLQHAHLLYRLRGTPEGLRLHIKLYMDVEPRILEHFKLRRWMFLDHTRLGDQTALWGDQIVKRLQLDENSQIGSFQLIDSGDPLHDPFHHQAHQFTVFIPLRQSDESGIQRQTLERILEMAKPAHALGSIQLIEPRFRVGIQSFVGVDTIIGRYPSSVIEGKGNLGFDTVLGPSSDEGHTPSMRVGIRSRIGSSTLID
ncbi:MAG TPA: phage tail protein [Pyrinomonadaceae bacterium]|jgi:phage tail-like protein